MPKIGHLIPSVMPGMVPFQPGLDQPPVWSYECTVPSKYPQASRSHTKLIVSLTVGVFLLVIGTAALTLWVADGTIHLRSRLQKVEEMKKPIDTRVSADANKQQPALEVTTSKEKESKKAVKVRFTVTYKYNNFVGNKPDTDAVIVLIPKNHKEKISGTFLSPTVARTLLEGTKKVLENSGAYVAIVGGDGKAVINRVRCGSYTLVIFSKHTNENPEISALIAQALEQYITDGKLLATLYKVHISTIEVSDGEEIELNHDFGLTFI